MSQARANHAHARTRPYHGRVGSVLGKHPSAMYGVCCRYSLPGHTLSLDHNGKKISSRGSLW